MQGVLKELVEHSLNVYKGAKPVKQGARSFGEKKRQAIGAKIVKLQEAKFNRVVVHTEWLANPVLVPKPNKDLRMCIDYTGLNKCCPKDHFALPRIDQVVGRGLMGSFSFAKSMLMILYLGHLTKLSMMIS